MSTLTEPSLDLTELESLIEDATPKCDNEDCERDATHTLTCGTCKKGTEFSCYPCIISMQEAARLGLWDGVVLFDPTKSCGHPSHISDCIINPL